MKKTFAFIVLILLFRFALFAQPQNEYIFAKQGSTTGVCDIYTKDKIVYVLSLQNTAWQAIKRSYATQSAFWLEFTNSNHISKSENLDLSSNLTYFTHGAAGEYVWIYWSSLASPIAKIGSTSINMNTSGFSAGSNPNRSIDIESTITLTENGDYTGTDVQWEITYNGGTIILGSGHTLNVSALDIANLVGYYSVFKIRSKTPYYNISGQTFPKSYRASYYGTEYLQIIPKALNIYQNNELVDDPTVCGGTLALKILTTAAQSLQWQVGQYVNLEMDWKDFGAVFITNSNTNSQKSIVYNDIKDLITNKDKTISFRAILSSNRFPITEEKGGFVFFNQSPGFSLQGGAYCDGEAGANITITPTVKDINQRFYTFYDQDGAIAADPDSIEFTSGNNSTTTGIVKENRYIRGNYITAEGNAVCPSVLKKATIVKNPNPSFAPGFPKATDESCYKKDDGQIEITAIGNTPPFTFRLNGNGLINMGPNSGTDKYVKIPVFDGYTLTIVDKNNCTFSKRVDIKRHTDPTITNSFSSTPITCDNREDGTLTFNGSVSGSSAIKYYLESTIKYESTTKTISGLKAGSGYKFYVTDANNCKSNEITNLIIPNAVPIPVPAQASITIKNQTCNWVSGDANGSITFAPTIGYTYSLIGGNGAGKTLNGDKFEGLQPANNYVIKVSRDATCSASSSTLTITNYTNPSIGSISTTPVGCINTNTGSLTANSISKGTSNQLLSISISGGVDFTECDKTLDPGNSNSITFAGLKVHEYTVTVKDKEGCLFTSAKVAVPGPNEELKIKIDSTKDIRCYGEMNGRICYTVSGGYGTKTTAKLYKDGTLTNKVPSGNKFTGLGTGNYTISVTDNSGNGCIASANTTIYSPTYNQMVIDEIYPNDVWCNAENANATYNNATLNNNGNVEINVTGGWSTKYKFEYSNNNSTWTTLSESSSGIQKGDLSPGTHYFRITDSKNCVLYPEVIIKQPAAMEKSYQVYNQVCYYEANKSQLANGKIRFPIVGGANYSYLLTKPDNSTVGPRKTQNFDSLPPVSGYRVTVSNISGCKFITPIINISNYQNPSILNANISATNVKCKGDNSGSIQVTGIYKGTSNALSSISIIGNIATSTNLTISPFDATSYNFDKCLKSDAYTIKVTDSKGCYGTANKFVDEPSEKLVIKAWRRKNVTCFGFNDGIIRFSYSGGTGTKTLKLFKEGIELNKTPLNGEYKDLPPGKYSITITDANMCTATYNEIDILSPSKPLSAELEMTKVFCDQANTLNQSLLKSGTLKVTNPDGGYGDLNDYSDYTYSNDNITFSDKYTFSGYPTGTYNIYIKDTAGCKLTLTKQITAEPKMIISQNSITDEICADTDNGQIKVSVTGGNPGYTLSLFEGTTNQNRTFTNIIQNGSIEYKPLKPSDNYNIRVADIRGCEARLDFQIKPYLNPQFDPSKITTIPLNCFNDGSGQINIAGINKGTSGQLSTIELTGAATTINNQVQNSFDATTKLYTGIGSDNYTISITDIKGCSANYVIEVTQPPKLVIEGIKLNDEICFNQLAGEISYTITGGTPGYNNPKINMNGGALDKLPTNNKFLGLAKGNYTIEVSDNHNCKSITTQIFVDGPVKAISSTASSTTIDCHINDDAGVKNNGVITITGTSGGYDPANGYEPYLFAIKPTLQANSVYSEYQPSNQFNSLIAGSYTIKIKDSKGCENFTLVQVVTANPELIITGNAQHEICQDQNNGRLLFSGSGGFGTLSYFLNSSEAGIVDLAPNSTENQNEYIGLKPATDYKITLTDQKGCSRGTTSGSLAVNKYFNPAFKANSLIFKPVTCFNADDGSIIVELDKAKSGAQSIDFSSFEWVGQTSGYSGINHDIIQLTQEFKDLSADVYKLTISDVNQCKGQPLYVTIKQPDSLQIAVNQIKNILYKGENSGALKLSVTGGNAGVQKIAAESYGFVKEDNQLQNTHQFTMDGLFAGEYILRVTDVKGCKSEIPDVAISEPEDNLRFIVVQKSDALCKAGIGQFTVKGIGGWGKYEFKGATRSNFHPNTLFDDLYAGNYWVTVRDSLGATYSQRVFINEPKDLLRADIIDSLAPTCGNNGLLAVKLQGGVQPYQLTYNPNDTLKIVAPYIFNDSTLFAGDYSMMIYDSNRCHYILEASLSGNQLLKIDSIAILSFPSDQEPVSKGELSALYNGGKEPLSFTWTAESDGFSDTIGLTSSINNLNPDLYKVSVNESSGCSVTGFKLLPSALTIPLTIDSISHERSYLASDGFIRLTGLIDNPQTLYINKNTEATQTIFIHDNQEIFDSINKKIILSHLSGGEYYIRLTNALNEMAYVRFTIIPYAELYISNVKVKHIKRHGGTDGSIEVAAKGGAGNYQFSWKDSNNESAGLQHSEGEAITIISGLLPGNYYLTVTDKYLNSVSASYTILEPDPMTINIEYDDISCKDSLDGFAEISAQGGWGDYQYKIDTALHYKNSGAMFGLKARNYKAYLIDKKGITDSVQFTINEPDYLRSSMVSMDSIYCAGSNQGAVYFHITGGNEPYKLKTIESEFWQNDTIADQLTANNYTFIFSDSRNCKSIDVLSVHLSEPDSLKFEKFDIKQSYCNIDNGSIDFKVYGGVKPFQYTVSNMEDQIISRLTHADSLLQGGQYLVHVKDKHQCVLDSIFIINSSKNPNITNLNIQAVKCFGQNNGKAEITNLEPAIPYAPFQINWSNGSTGLIADQLQKGNYFVQVTDTNNCSTTRYFDVDEPQALTAFVSDSAHISCYNAQNGYIDLISSGGVEPYQYTWSNGMSTPSITDLKQGIYSVSITDANSCIWTNNFTLNQPAPLEAWIEKVDSLKCKGNEDGFIWFGISGGTKPYSFNETTGNEWITDTAVWFVKEGSYTYAITDANHCLSNGLLNINITAPDSLLFNTFNVNHTTCEQNNGALSFNTKGGTLPYKYSISDAQDLLISQTTSANNLLPNHQYFVNVIDRNNCTIKKETYIKSSLNPAIGNVFTKPVLCYGESTGKASVDLVIPGQPESPWSLKWSNNKTGYYAEGFEYGTHYVTVTDSNHCSSTRYFTIESPHPLLLRLIDSSHVKCFGNSDGRLNIESRGGTGQHHYLWSRGDTLTSILNLLQGTYQVTVSDSNNCSLSDTFIIGQPPKLSASVYCIDSLMCKGDADGQVIFALTGGTEPYAFKDLDSPYWNVDTVARYLEEGVFIYQFTDAHNCSSDNEITINMSVPDSLLIRDVELTHTTCNRSNGAISFTSKGGIGPYNYLITDYYSNIISETTFADGLKPAGQYLLFATDAHNCKDFEETFINPSTSPEINKIESEPVLCFGDSNGKAYIKSVTPANPYSPWWITWSNNDTGMVTNRYAKGIHFATITDSTNCSSELYFEITSPLPLSAELTDSMHARCFEGNEGFITIKAVDGTPNYQFNWSNGDTTATASNLAKGEYIVTVTDRNGCLFQNSFFINQPPKIADAGIPNEFTLCTGQIKPYLLESQWNNSTWLLPNGSQSAGNQVQLSDAGWYHLQTHSNKGCLVIDSLQVFLSDNILQADFLMASEAYVNDTVIIIELSWPIADNLIWKFPEQASEVYSADNYKGLLFTDKGNYYVELTASAGNCASVKGKYISIIDGSNPNTNGQDSTDSGFISKFIAYPNPASDQVSFTIELKEEADVRIELLDWSGTRLNKVIQSAGLKEYHLPLPINNLMQGTYMVRLITGSQVKIKLIVVQ